MPIGSFGYNAGEISYTWAESQVLAFTNSASRWARLKKILICVKPTQSQFPGGCGRACPGRLCSCQPVLWPECCWKQVCVIVIKLPKKGYLELCGLSWSDIPILSPKCILWRRIFFRSIATIRLSFARTIGYYFLRTYFPLIIIVFWWDNLLLYCPSLQQIVIFPDEEKFSEKVKYLHKLFQFLHLFLAGQDWAGRGGGCKVNLKTTKNNPKETTRFKQTSSQSSVDAIAENITDPINHPQTQSGR